MYRVLIFGTGVTANKVIDCLKKNINVVAFIDNNSEKHGKYFNNKIIDSPKNVSKYDYDYIIIASQYNFEIYNQLVKLKINSEVILQFYVFCDLFKNYIDDSLKKVKNYAYEGIVTGISYTMSAIKEEEFSKKFIKLAFPSQDLFYDYKLSEYVIKNTSSKIKYAIIGLSYYSFEYDLSLSSMKNKTILYRNIPGYLHNFKNIDEIISNYEISKKIANKIFDDVNISYGCANDNFSLSQNKEYTGKYQASLDCSKKYPKTVEENIDIFDKYLKMLIENNIKPIVIICPTTKYYSKWFNLKMIEQHETIINNFKEKYEFEYINYFKLEIFEDSDFGDVSHLNEKGAIKFTKMLNEEIIW